MAAEEAEVKLSESAEFKEMEDPIIELGDRIRISGGKYDKTTGRVVYRTENELHLMPDGMTNLVIEFILTEEGFDPSLEVEAVEILQKRKKNTIVEILDLRPGQDLETFNENGDPVSKYEIISVDTTLDIITIKNDEEGELTIPFTFRGIPKGLPFRIVRGRQAIEKSELQGINEGLEEDAFNDESTNAGTNEEEEEESDDFEFLDNELLAPADDLGVERLIEIPTSERTYSSQSQKSEAYADLLALNSDARQKLSETQRSMRVLTELFFQLRASILRVSDDGTPRGIKVTSIQTLADALELRKMVLSRCVVDIDKILYHDVDTEEDPQPETMEGLRFQSFNEKIEKANTFIESSPDMVGQKFTQFLNTFLKKYGASWKPSGQLGTVFTRDEEVFRRNAPSNDSESSIPGYSLLPDKKGAYVSSSFVTEVSMSLMRGLKPLRIKSQVIQEGEEASTTAYVLFPLKYASSLSTARSESLVSDIKDGQREFLSIKNILRATGEISEIPSSSDPFLISVTGGTLGNISLRDYIKSLGIRAEGLGDFWQLQVLLGINDREWTIDQFEVLKELIAQTQNQILQEITSQRDTLSQQVVQPPAVQGILMVPDGPQIMEKLAEEPLLKDIQANLKEQMPSFASSDVLMVGYVLRAHPELSMAQLANQPAALAKMRMIYARNEYLKALKDIQLKKERIDFAGLPPEPIKCSHVKPLQMIRKVKDDKVRLALLAKFLITFQGQKEDNWVKCNAGDHNLLCVHELLQIYQFLRPGDVSALNKEIHINFGGGQFQGHYICRNCGQPISELEYDTHLEFDDSGKPMMGRSELVDKDAINEDQIEDLLGPLIAEEDEEEYEDETKKLIYTTAREIADRLLAPLEGSDYKLIVQRVGGLIQTLPDRKRFSLIQEAQKKGRVATVVANSIDYDVYLNQVLVCATAVHILLVIQSRKPDLIMRGMPGGCKNLGGQPLEAEGTSGINCVVSIISSFQKDVAPWSFTQFQKELDDTQRQKMIMGIFEPIMRASLQDPTILQALSQKREYIRKILGSAGGQGRPDEQLPANFAPIPYVTNEEDFVEKVIIPEAATEADRVELWIRQGNILAKKNKMPMPLVFNEASCCLSPIQKADEFWTSGEGSQSLPPFSRRTGVEPPPKITRIEPIMKPSQISRPLPDAPEESYYRLFMKVCYDGENKGQAHEFGLTRKCIWCNLTLPRDVELLNVEQGLAAIESQGVEVTKESFEELLNETHIYNSFVTKFNSEIPGPLTNWISLLQMEPEPVEGFREMINATNLEFEKLPSDAKEESVALALSEFSSMVEDYQRQFKERIPPSQHDIFESIVQGGASSVIRFLQSYILVPLSQFISKQSSNTTVPKSWNLSWQHQMDLSSILASHKGYLTKFSSIKETQWLREKIETFIAQARAILNRLENLRPLQIPGGKHTFRYFLQFCLYAPLANFINPNTLPIAEGTEVPSHVEQQALFPAKFVSEMVKRFNEEGLNLTPERIRELIAIRKEKEATNILRKMTKMSRSEKEVAKIQMKFGLGEWAVGGTSAIYKYDGGQYDKERDQRAEAGIVSFPEFAPEGAIQEGRKDALGYFEGQGDEEGYIGDGDLGDINHFDDDN